MKLTALGLTLPLGIAGAVARPVLADAKPVTLTTTLNSYGGDGAYLAIYVTDPQGKIHSTLRVAGKKAKYYKHLSAWSRATGGRVDGTTGASVGSGQTLKFSVEIADALIDAGYEIRIDSAVENDRDVPVDVKAPLASSNAGKPIPGKGYVKSFTFTM